MQRISRILSVFLLSVFVFPGTAQAVSAYDALSTYSNDDIVTRGDFIRAAVQVLDMENMAVDQRRELPYRRVAKGQEKFVRVAHKKNALEVFGFDLLLAQGITRGEALRVVVNLTSLDTAKPVAFNDVRVGTPMERAVRVAVDRDWMAPLQEDYFGVTRKLTGKQAKTLLDAVSGEEEVQTSDFQRETPTIKINLGTTQRIGNLPKTQILESIWSVIERQFLYTDDIDVDEAAWAAAEGLANSLGDKYTTFMRPARARAFQTQIQGEVTGIGAQVEYVDDVLTIVSPIKGSPAEEAGLQPGDQILKADGEELSGLDFLDAVEKVRGPKGSIVKLTIRRNGVELEKNVRRDVIRVPEDTITWQDDILVVEISQFGKVTEQDLGPILEDLMDKNPSGLILDLRKNPGGLLSAADSVLSLFLPYGTAFVEVKSRDEERRQYTTRQQVVPDSVPVVVLIDEGSASASEIVAGAMQDLDRAVIVGSKSFGKGTVQQVLQFNDQSSLKLTIAEWFTPNGTKIDGIGIYPDVGVGEVDGRDAPMLKALELLR